MESALLGVVLDSSTAITAERRNLPVPQLVEAIQTAHGEIEISLSPVTVAELVHGIYRAKTPEASQRWLAYIEELADLVPIHPVPKQTAFLVGRIQGNGIFGAGTSAIQDDGPSVPNGTQISMDNTAEITTVCAKHPPSPVLLF